MKRDSPSITNQTHVTLLLEPVYAIAMHPKEPTIMVSGGGDDKSYIWRNDTGEMLYELSGHTDSVTAVGFSVDGEYVASAGMDGKVRVWKSATGEFCTAVEGPDEIVVCIWKWFIWEWDY